MDNVWIGKAPCGKSTLDARYMLEVPDHAQSEEMLILCRFLDLARSCGMQTRLDVIPYEDRGHNQFGSTKECEIIVYNVGAYGIL